MEDEQILEEIQPLNEVEARAAIPERLKNVAWLKEAETLEMSPSIIGTSGDEQEVINDD